MADPLRRAQPGRRQNIPTDAYNAFVEAAQAERLDRFGGGPESGGQVHSLVSANKDVIYVKNESGYDLSALDAVEPYDSAIGPFASFRHYESRAVLKVRRQTTDYGHFLIVLEPIAKNRIGRALASGVTPARVMVESGETGSNYNIAVSEASSFRLHIKPRSLASEVKTWADVLWKSTGSDSIVPRTAVVRVGSERRNIDVSGVFLSRSSTTTLASPIVWTSEDLGTTTDYDYWDSGDPTIITVPLQGYYQLQAHYKISNPPANTTFETWFQDSSTTVFGRSSQYIGSPLACYLSCHALVACGALEEFTAHVSATAWTFATTAIEGRWTLQLVGPWTT